MISKEMCNKMVRLYQKGFSTRKIAMQLKIGKTTVHTYLHKEGTKLRNGNLKEIKKSFKKLTPEKAYILGVIGPGDGYVVRDMHNKIYKIGLGVIDKEFIDYFIYCIKKTYGLFPPIFIRKPKKIQHSLRYVTEVSSKRVFEDVMRYNVSFREKDWEVPLIIKNAPENIKLVYIKGIADSQGHVNERYKYIIISSKNEEGLREIQKMLLNSGINSSIEKNGLAITSRKFLDLFDKKVGFIIPRKREALRRTLKSYKIWTTPIKEVKRLVPKMIELRNKGLKVTRIAKELGLSDATIVYRLKQNMQNI